jgi:hypothetical protein
MDYAIFINARVGNIRRRIFTDIRFENIIGWPIKMEHKQTFSNLRQNQQCSLPQVRRLRGDSIFAFAQPVPYHGIFVDQLGFLVTIILGGDSLNKTFSPKRTRCQISVLFPLRLNNFNWSSRYPDVTHDMLKNWSASLLGSRAYCSYVQLSVILGCSILSVSKSNQEILFHQPDCSEILFFKMILSDFKSFMEVLVLYV